MKKKVFSVLILVCLAFTTTSCNSILQAAKEAAQESAAQAATATASPTATPVPTPEPIDDTEKFNAFISASNVMLDRMELCLEGYGNRICSLEDEYKVDKKTFKGWINSIGDSEIKRLKTSQEYAAKDPNMDPVDAIYLELAPLAISVVETLSQVYNYYETKGYVDDDYVKGEEMHNELMASVGDYYVLASEFIVALNEMSHERMLEQMEVFKEDGRMLLYYSNVFILEIEEACTVVMEAEQSKNNMLVDADAYGVPYARLVEAHTEFTKIATSEQAEKEGLGTWFSSFKSAMDEAKAAASTIAQKLNAGDSVSVSDVEKLYEKYSDLIDDYNRMI